jgi:hypothetical protein
MILERTVGRVEIHPGVKKSGAASPVDLRPGLQAERKPPCKIEKKLHL